ncbi:hypothetical protein Y1Q_0005763 [Alligator mississippiensis]|uniref:Uncharacterized protein n=1 Tax=Alligator mississippiensis TaxID=8496 RepID=A0A151MFU5_ALLMI|nr:hypothetical protein Y1Q_0005763 [Alligator mississippiensis]
MYRAFPGWIDNMEAFPFPVVPVSRACWLFRSLLGLCDTLGEVSKKQSGQKETFLDAGQGKRRQNHCSVQRNTG